MHILDSSSAILGAQVSAAGGDWVSLLTLEEADAHEASWYVRRERIPACFRDALPAFLQARPKETSGFRLYRPDKTPTY